MDNVQFRDYIFEHNPAVITVEEGAQAVSHPRPEAGDYLQVQGPKGRTVTCKGAFLGGDCAEASAKLADFRAAAGEQTGILFLPGREPFPAVLTHLASESSGDGRILPYTMVFREVTA